MAFHNNFISDGDVVSGDGNSGCNAMINLNEATTEISKPQAASAEMLIIQLINFLGEAKTMRVISNVTEIPPKNTPTNDICSATSKT